jgi:hypothetical protein
MPFPYPERHFFVYTRELFALAALMVSQWEFSVSAFYTLKNQVHDDYCCYHVVCYDTANKSMLAKEH